ncbi:AAA family ATPase [Streptomyces zingiberis]|nr:LuxR family transcriptional regulator [Streptomyces zingiberis]
MDDGHCAAVCDVPAEAMYGRDACVARVVDAATGTATGAVTGTAGTPLVLVTGPAGIGRSTVLAAAREAFAARGLPTLTLRVARNERDRPYSLAARLSAELAVRHRNGDPRRAVAVRAAAPGAGPDTGRQLAAELRTSLAASGAPVVLIDDAQWADPGSRAVLLTLLRAPGAGPVRFVCAFRPSPADPEGDRAALERLRAAGLAEVVPLRPLGSAEVRALVAQQLQAKPSPSLLGYLNRECRGRPAAVLTALAGYRRSDSLCVFDRHAFLPSPNRPPSLPAGLPPVEYLRQLGGLVWPVAKALAVLHPLGPEAARLVSEAVGADADEVGAALTELWAEGVLWQGPRPGHWRFRLPLLASALITCLGPYERRRLAQLAVTAIWAGEATADGPYLAEQLVAAGRFVDARRASGELIALGTAAMLEDGYAAERRLRAAAELATEPERRARALLAHAATCCIHLRHTDALESAWTVLSEHAGLVTPEALLEMEMIYVVSLGGVADRAALTEICEGGWRKLPGGEGHRSLTRALALCHLDRWREADECLTRRREAWAREGGTVAALGMLFSDCIAAYLGRTEAFDRMAAAPPGWPLWSEESRHRFEQLSQLARALMALGELDRAQRLLAAHALPSDYRPLPDRVVADSLAGRWDPALSLARLGLATGLSVGDLPTHTLMSRETSIILGARGQLARAREVIDRARAVQPVALHLLALAEWCLDLSLGDLQRGNQVIADALTLAVERGLVVGTEELWLMRAVSELAGGDRAAAQRCLDELSRIADQLGTGRARMCRLLGTAVVHQDRAAADEAIRVVRHRAQPLEQADTMTMLVRHRLADPSLLHEAYALYGDLDALLRRAQLRNVMRGYGLALPRQSQTTAENERLLATLVAEGLTNRELAVVLEVSEKSVESRLGRLFKRTGYRSRVELTSAMLTGEYPG